uniref:Uncharacterized protein n=1 Tax=viral metagenome TaxID=1070528 RepID=A0A6M3JI64_9ZZZZ
MIDCPYYKEFMTGRNGNSPTNCFDEDAWHGDRIHCNVPGQTYPICDYKKNGWKNDVFVAKVDKSKLKECLEKWELSEALKPVNLLRRLLALEVLVNEKIHKK